MRKIRKFITETFIAGMAALLLSLTPGFANTGDIPAKKQTELGLYVTALQAAEMLKDPHVLFVDVRTRAEVAFVGLPTRANVNIPVMVLPPFAEFNAAKGTYKLEQNPEFVSVFEKYVADNGYGKDSRIILICRSGSRSAKAANILKKQGFTKVYSLIDGFEGDKAADGPNKGRRVLNGWKNAGLSWSYRVNETQVYPADR